MPIYSYKCNSCGITFEEVQRITEEPLTKCPEEKCKGEVRRQIPRTSFILQGGGWGKDGY